MEEKNCVLCESVEIARERDCSRPDIFNIECNTCGTYHFSEQLMVELRKISRHKRVLFSGALRIQKDVQRIYCSHDVKEIQDKINFYDSLSLMERKDLLLRYIGGRSNSFGDKVPLHLSHDYVLFFFRNKEEFVRVIEYLMENQYIENVGLVTEADRGREKFLTLTFKGWNEFEGLRKSATGKKAFVAMNFDKEYDVVYEDAIKPACEACEFDAYRVDKEEHNKKICDKIISEIKSARFVICEFTGQKNGVYYEAGFAEGLGLEVIKCCRKDEVDDKKLHFDTRQYSHIAWTTLEDLREQLINRIRATI